MDIQVFKLTKARDSCFFDFNLPLIFEDFINNKINYSIKKQDK